MKRIYSAGLIIAIFSFVLFLLAQGELSDKPESVFFINYIFCTSYGVWVLIYSFLKRKKLNPGIFAPLLVISLLSCYTLNILIPVFPGSVMWFNILLVLTGCLFLVLPVFNKLPGGIRSFISFITGISIIVFLYLAIYLIPYYALGAFFCWVIGIPLHVFIPLIFLIYTVWWVMKVPDKRERKCIYSGSTISLLIILVFSTMWGIKTKEINRLIHEETKTNIVSVEDKLNPEINLASRLEPGFFTEQILLTDLTYEIPEWENYFSSWEIPDNNFSEKRIHNPLIVMACKFGGESDLTKKEKIQLLEYIYNSRHESTERFWTGKGIRTQEIQTHVNIWPQYRMAYTEQIFHIQSTSYSQGEAIYTFHLPEGSVVSSLSLWIDGEERKGVITTKEKAESAYNTIVGIESRDPSLVIWRENSIVTVKVFPVSSREERQMKIGFTSPLYTTDKNIVYKPVKFQGTDFSSCKEKLKVQIMEENLQPEFPSFLKKEGETLYAEKKYNTDWELIFNKIPVKNESFSYNNYSYRLKELENYFIPVNLNRIYLDINSSWTKKEYEEIYALTKGMEVNVYFRNELITLTDENYKSVFSELQKAQFSLFPIYKIKQKENSLLISKSNNYSPNLRELEGTAFLKTLKKNIHPGEKVYFYNIGTELSPYLNSLLAYRLLDYRQGNIEKLKQIIDSRSFPDNGQETDNRIIINQAEVYITKEAGKKPGQAPDHLMRLFTYNHILKEYSTNWETDSISKNKIINEALEANIVTPVSSLIVLETGYDYKRFDIKEPDLSLGNAFYEEAESAPVKDPEIVIILIFLAFYILFKKIKVHNTNLNA